MGSPLEARHVGLPPEFVNGLLDDLVAYINRDDGIPIVRVAIAHACVLRERLTSHVEALSQRWTVEARRAGIRSSSAAFKLLEALPQHPIVTADSAAGVLSGEPRTAQRAVARLAKLGILQQRSAGRRNRVFECGDMMAAFTEATREQPAANLTLFTPADAVGPTLSASRDLKIT